MTELFEIILNFILDGFLAVITGFILYWIIDKNSKSREKINLENQIRLQLHDDLKGLGNLGRRSNALNLEYHFSKTKEILLFQKISILVFDILDEVVFIRKRIELEFELSKESKLLISDFTEYVKEEFTSHHERLEAKEITAKEFITETAPFFKGRSDLFIIVNQSKLKH